MSANVTLTRALILASATLTIAAGAVFAGGVDATYVTGSEVPVTAREFAALGKTLNVSLNFAPAPGAQLTVVRNTGPGMIHGTFSNLAQGQTISLTYSGLTFKFVANYHGGRGNDLVLLWTTDGDLSQVALKKLDAQLVLALKQSRALPPFDKPTSLQPSIPVKDRSRALVDVEGQVTKELLDSISAAGGDIVNGFVTSDKVRAMVPVAQLETLAARSDVTAISPTKPSIRSRLKVQ
jgi:hypothetical protein